MPSLNLMEGSHVWQCGSYAFVGDNHRPAGYCFSLFPPSRAKMSINTEVSLRAGGPHQIIGVYAKPRLGKSKNIWTFQVKLTLNSWSTVLITRLRSSDGGCRQAGS